MSQEDFKKIISKEQKPLTESKEGVVTDFKKIFDEKLASIEPMSEEDAKWEAIGMENLGIQSIKRKCPCIIIYELGNVQTGCDLWVSDPKDCSSRYPHSDVEQEFDSYKTVNNIQTDFGTLSAYIMEINGGVKYLFFDSLRAKYRKEDVKTSEFIRNRYMDLIQKYGIEKIIGKFGYSEYDNILDEDIFGKIRENSYLVSFGEKYKMTNTQYLRFWLKATAAFQAEKEQLKNSEGKEGIKYISDLDTLAKESIEQNKEE